MCVVLDTGILPHSMGGEILCTINKVPGSNDVNDTRPIALLSMLRNLLFRNQLEKVMYTLERLHAVSDWQAEFRRNTGTDTALIETRLVSEHCYTWRKDVWIGDEDKKHAFDSPQVEGSIDMGLDRMGVPYRLIMLVVASRAAS